MKYQILKNITLRTSKGETKLSVGQVVTLSGESVKPLLEQGYIIPLREAIEKEFKSWRQWLQEYSIFAPDLKAINKGMYNKLMALNKAIDKAGLKEDYRGFLWAISAYKRYHLECLEANSNLLELWG